MFFFLDKKEPKNQGGAIPYAPAHRHRAPPMPTRYFSPRLFYNDVLCFSRRSLCFFEDHYLCSIAQQKNPITFVTGFL